MTYKIIELNFEEGYQRELCQIAYLDRAKERCQIYALNYVIQKEGIGYLNYFGKNKIHTGYNLKCKDKPYYMKITVLRKEPNGYLTNGALIKITQFITIKFKPEPFVAPRKKAPTEFNCQHFFMKVLDEYKKKYLPAEEPDNMNEPVNMNEIEIINEIKNMNEPQV